MEQSVNTPDEYVSQLAEDTKQAIQKLRRAIIEYLPKGFIETISYGRIVYVVPRSLYPKSYHFYEKLPLPFISIAAQKNFVAVYRMGIYVDENLLKWFAEEFPKHSEKKLDMGKSCIRFTNLAEYPPLA